MTELRIHSKEAWNVASKFSHVLASSTRDLAAHIDLALAAERERCAKIAEHIGVLEADPADEYERGLHSASKRIAATIRNKRNIRY